MVSFTRGGLYYVGVLDEAALRSRFSLVEVDEEGVLLDRESGAVFLLNRTAHAIWAELLAGTSLAAIVATMVQRFGIAHDQAEDDARTTLSNLPDDLTTPKVKASRPGAGRWVETPGGYALFEGDAATCEVDREGTVLRLPAGAQPTEGEARARIRSVVPRILALRGIHLLHASAVELDGSLLIITGPSGAGKTTSARAFARTGARLVSEDLLVFESTSAVSRAVIGGEVAIRAWVADGSARLARRPDEAIACAELDLCLEGPRLPISEVWIIDAAGRTGGQIRLEPLRRPDALVALMESVYFASSDAASWRARFESLRDLVAAALTARATMPDGLSALDAGVGAFRQREMIAS